MKIIVYIWIMFALLVHLAGIGIYIDGVRLYDIWVIKWVIKYDMLAHLLNCLFLAVIFKRIFKLKKWQVILIVMGIGAVFELIELLFVVFFDSQKAVGGYMNNALDILFNLLGALIGSIL